MNWQHGSKVVGQALALLRVQVEVTKVEMGVVVVLGVVKQLQALEMRWKESQSWLRTG